MHFIRIAFILSWLACAAAQAQVAASEPATSAPSSAASSVAVQLLSAGKAHLEAKNPQAAIADVDQLIGRYDEQYKGSTQTVYGARSLVETLFYLAQAATEKKNAIVIEPFWGDAHYMKGYALIELGQLDAAETSLKRALELSPRSSFYLNELGDLYKREKSWDKATETFLKAAEAANISPAEDKNDHLSRAWRGLGYVDVELGKLTEAESLYKRCMELNPGDKKAAGELQYIQAQRDKQRLANKPTN